MKAALPWLISAVTLVGIYEQGQKRSRGWAIGLANQALWITMAIWFRTWGLLPLSGALVVLYSRNLVIWRAHEASLIDGLDAPGNMEP